MDYTIEIITVFDVKKFMRIALVAILLMSVMNPLFTQVELQDESPVLLADGNGVQVIEEIEPNNVNTTGQSDSS